MGRTAAGDWPGTAQLMNMPKKDTFRDPAAHAVPGWRLSRRSGRAQTAPGTVWRRITDELLAVSWPISLVLALTAFTTFQYLLPALLGPQDTGALDMRYVGWSLTLLFLFIGAVSWWTTRQSTPVPADLLDMPWLQFESLLGEIFRLDGHALIETRSRAEHFDLSLDRAGKTAIVQARRWRRKAVDAAAVQELLSEMIARQADTGVLVSTSSFTPAARELAQDHGIRLVAGPELARLALAARVQPENPVIEAPDEATAKGQSADSSTARSAKSRQT